ncbi:hypothetical protein M378DRAFT_960414 [Amanita muscaria Koide BX008]|uniref:Uncharacterized protein n=1 Tax=Amanita muscaria (strain Koide BX008) TaxID=946122 RepID=A0A0C2WUK7_AMAMK|nr:hypothetical protein M378DRAFT_960414 [Amanita muscaria Koide BX008]
MICGMPTVIPVERVKTILRPLTRFTHHWTIDALCSLCYDKAHLPFDTLSLIIPFTLVRFTDSPTV